MTGLGSPVDLLSGFVARVTGHSPRQMYRRLSVAEALLEREVVFGRSVRIPWRRRVALWRHGFTSRSGVLFGVDHGEYDRFVSDYHLELLDELGGQWGEVADNKLLSHLLLGAFDEHLPDLHGVLDGGTLTRRSPTGSPVSGTPDSTDGVDAFEWIDAYLDANDAVVLKPIYGYGGKGILFCERGPESGEYRVNGTTESRSAFVERVADLETYLASEFVEQAPYADALFPDSANTLRVLTLWDYDAGEPFVAGAVQRIGTAASAPVDNWSGGGLSAEVTPDGTLTAGARWSSSAGELRRHETHPDTGGRIEGTRVPGWPAVRERVLEMAAAFPYLPRVGWDVVLTDDGRFVVLEINTHPGIETVQVHGPLLDDPRVRRFHEHHGYI